MKPNDQEHLIVLFNKGDRGAFKSIYDKLSPGVFQHIKRFVKTRQEAEDVLSETFSKLWARRGRFETMGKLISFLLVTSKNKSIDRRRRAKMEDGNREEMLLTILKEHENVGIMDSVAEHLLNQIYEEIENLPGKPRDVLKLAYIEELTNAEIARQLGTSEKTVRNQKASALKRLRIGIINRLGFGSFFKKQF